MRKSLSLPIFIFCLSLSSTPLLAQTKPATAPAAAVTASPNSPVTPVISAYPTTPAEFFARARQLSDLESSGIPFHLKATFVVGDTLSDNTGTYEEWWMDKDHWRKAVTLDKFRYVTLKNGTGDEKVYANLAYVPWHVTQVLGSIFFRVPINAASAHWKMRHKKIKQIDYMTLSDKNRHFLFAEQGILRIQSVGNSQVIYNNFRTFQNLVVPCTVAVGNGDSNDSLTISIQSIEKLPTSQEATSTITAIPHDLQPLAEPVPNVMRVAYGVTPPVLVHRVDPALTESVRMRHQGMDTRVLVDLIVDTKGNVVGAHIVQSSGSDFDSFALNVVRQYRFKPALFKGHAVPVELVVEVHYHIR